MNKLFTLVAIAGLGLSTLGCAESAPPPPVTPPADVKPAPDAAPAPTDAPPAPEEKK